MDVTWALPALRRLAAQTDQGPTLLARRTAREQRDQLARALRDGGMSLGEIAEQVGRSRSTVQRWCGPGRA